MLQRELLGTADLPDGGQLRLLRHGRDFSIMLGSNELMNSRMSGSEEALATLACARLPTPHAPHLLIGGLGMGFTLRTALATLGPDARITVVELLPDVIDWARGPMAELFGGCLDDRRVTLIEDDVRHVIAPARAEYDAILLDVDNGPDGLTQAANGGLYSAAGLRAARAALVADGVLAIWSAAPDAGFVGKLERTGFAVEEEVVRAHGGRGARHVIWLAR